MDCTSLGGAMEFRRPFTGLFRVTFAEFPIFCQIRLPAAQRLHHTSDTPPLQPLGLRFSSDCDMICPNSCYRPIEERWLFELYVMKPGRPWLARPELDCPTPTGARCPPTLGNFMSRTVRILRRTERSPCQCGTGTITTVHSQHLLAILL